MSFEDEIITRILELSAAPPKMRSFRIAPTVVGAQLGRFTDHMTQTGIDHTVVGDVLTVMTTKPAFIVVGIARHNCFSAVEIVDAVKT